MLKIYICSVYNEKMYIKYRVFVNIHGRVEDNEVLKFQRISAKPFNVRNQIKSVFVTVCNTCCIINCKIQMINSQKLIKVWFLNWG